MESAIFGIVKNSSGLTDAVELDGFLVKSVSRSLAMSQLTWHLTVWPSSLPVEVVNSCGMARTLWAAPMATSKLIERIVALGCIAI